LLEETPDRYSGVDNQICTADGARGSTGQKDHGCGDLFWRAPNGSWNFFLAAAAQASFASSLCTSNTLPLKYMAPGETVFARIPFVRWLILGPKM
jgi:hypothetical protein